MRRLEIDSSGNQDLFVWSNEVNNIYMICLFRKKHAGSKIYSLKNTHWNYDIIFTKCWKILIVGTKQI